MKKVIVLSLALIGVLFLAITGAYWWSNTPPARPSDVSANAVFLWAGHVGLPAEKHGTWIECWTDTANGVNKCKLTEMDGGVEYEGTFLADTGRNPIPESDLKIVGEPTSDVTHWVHIGESGGAPLVFLKNGSVLIPKDAYQEGMTKLENLRQEQRK